MYGKIHQSVRKRLVREQRKITGLVANTDAPAPDIVVQDITVPIVAETVYIHTSKITLDAEGRHRWTKTSIPPAYKPLSSGQMPGDIGALRSITVRQATRANKGYVGYSWQSYSLGVEACETGRADSSTSRRI